MSAYKPHTDDVAMAYIHATNGDTWVAGRADALRAEFYRWLAEHDREVKAEAWDECGQEIHGDHYPDTETYLRNPYRKETE